MKKTIEKESKLPAGADIPSKMNNIQILREQLVDGKNKNWISNVEFLDVQDLLKEHTEATKTSKGTDEKGKPILKTKEEKKRDTARRNEIRKELQKIYADKVWPKIKSLKK